MRYSSSVLSALVGSASAGTLLWDGRFNDMTSSTDLNNWSWSNQVGEYQYYIHGDGNVTEYVNLSPDYKNAADTSSKQGVRITLDSTSQWEGQTMYRTELIPQTTAAINEGTVFYHFSMQRTDTNAPESDAEHQVCFFESHFTEMKYGLLSGESGTSDTNLRWMANSETQWNVTFEAGVWHNIAYEIDFSANTVGFWHSTGADDLTQIVAPVSASTSSNGADWHLGVLRLTGTATEDWYFSGVYVESGDITTSVIGPSNGTSSDTASSAASTVAASTAAAVASSSAAATSAVTSPAVVSSAVVSSSSAVSSTALANALTTSSAAYSPSAAASLASSVYSSSTYANATSSAAAPTETGDDGCDEGEGEDPATTASAAAPVETGDDGCDEGDDSGSVTTSVAASSTPISVDYNTATTDGSTGTVTGGTSTSPTGAAGDDGDDCDEEPTSLASTAAPVETGSGDGGDDCDEDPTSAPVTSLVVSSTAAALVSSTPLALNTTSALPSTLVTLVVPSGTSFTAEVTASATASAASGDDDDCDDY